LMPVRVCDFAQGVQDRASSSDWFERVRSRGIAL
jgi:hypothetical protein